MVKYIRHPELCPDYVFMNTFKGNIFIVVIDDNVLKDLHTENEEYSNVTRSKVIKTLSHFEKLCNFTFNNESGTLSVEKLSFVCHRLKIQNKTDSLTYHVAACITEEEIILVNAKVDEETFVVDLKEDKEELFLIAAMLVDMARKSK